MRRSEKTPLALHRARKAREGFVRVEVNVRKEDANLVRDVAAALTDPGRRVHTRAILQRRLREKPEQSLKALLAAAPFDGIALDRDRDAGRAVDL